MGVPPRKPTPPSREAEQEMLKDLQTLGYIAGGQSDAPEKRHPKDRAKDRDKEQDEEDVNDR
jgi:hypothetical protein